MDPNGFEKRALKSKKFLAFLLIEAGFFGLMFAMVFQEGYENNAEFITCVITAGFLASFFIGGQALVDKYTRVALIAKGSVAKFGSDDSPSVEGGSDSVSEDSRYDSHDDEDLYEEDDFHDDEDYLESDELDEHEDEDEDEKEEG